MPTFITNTNVYGQNIPREAAEHPHVAVGSPLAVIGLFVLAIQHRFSLGAVGSSGLRGDSTDLRTATSWEDEAEVEPLPWIWTGSLRPTDECLPVSEYTPRPLYVGPAYEKNSSVRNYRPAVYVDRGNVSVQKIAIDNSAGRHLPSGLSAYGALAKIPVEIDCFAENYADCSLLADTVWFYILASRNVLCTSFGFHQIVEPVLSKVMPVEEDKTVFRAQIYCDVELMLRWSSRPITPLINDIALMVHKEGSADEALIEIVLRESRS